MEYEINEKQLENPTSLAPSGTPYNLCHQLLSNNNCQMFVFLQEFVSNNIDMTRVLLNKADKPIKFIDFQYKRMRSGLYDLKVFVSLEYYMWFEIVIDSKKYIILKTRHCTGFKHERFKNDIENRILGIMFKTSKPIFKNSIKITSD